jgi:SPP1 gp7 family putative phage head morphogenesis protein
MPTVAELLTLRRPRRVSRSKLEAMAPRQPRALELEYTASLVAIVRSWSAKVRRAVMPHIDAYARQDVLFGPAGAAFNQLRAEVQSVERTSRAAERMGRKIDRFAREEMQRTVAISAGDEFTTLIDRFRRANVELVKSVQYRQLDELEALLSNAGTMSVDVLSDRIIERFAVSESRAALIARDQTLKLNSQIQQEQQKQAGVEQYVWLAIGDSRTREDHADLNGTTHDWSMPPVVDEETGRRAHPGQDINCRCQAIPVIN